MLGQGRGDIMDVVRVFVIILFIVIPVLALVLSLNIYNMAYNAAQSIDRVPIQSSINISVDGSLIGLLLIAGVASIMAFRRAPDMILFAGTVLLAETIWVAVIRSAIPTGAEKVVDTTTNTTSIAVSIEPNPFFQAYIAMLALSLLLLALGILRYIETEFR